jgi:Tol biopolymer transport system component
VPHRAARAAFLTGLAVGLSLLVAGCTWMIYRWARPHQSLADAIAVTNPQWSPNGDYLAVDCAFSSGSRFAFDAYDPEYELCLVRPDLTGLIRLTPDLTRSSSWSPDWAPDGTTLAFAQPRDKGVIIAAVSDHQRVEIPASCFSVAWSPDGQQLMCASDQGLQVIAVATGQLTRLPIGDYIDISHTLPWLPQGQALLLERERGNDPVRSDLVLVDLVTGRERTLLANVYFYQLELTIAPAGTHLVYLHHTPSGSSYSRSDTTGLILLDLATGASSDLLPLDPPCFQDVANPQWSPDGRYLAFAAKPVSGRRQGGQIYILDMQTHAIFQATTFADTHADALAPPSWSPDSAFIATAFGEHNQWYNYQVAVVPATPADLEPVQCAE